MLLHDNRMQAELGITLALAHHRSGYTLETGQAVREHLFGKGLYRGSAECDIRNAPSARLLLRKEMPQDRQGRNKAAGSRNRSRLHVPGLSSQERPCVCRGGSCS